MRQKFTGKCVEAGRLKAGLKAGLKAWAQTRAQNGVLGGMIFFVIFAAQFCRKVYPSSDLGLFFLLLPV